MIDRDDETVPDINPIALVLKRLAALDAKMDDTCRVAQRTCDLQMALVEHFKLLEARVSVIEQRHVWLPIAAMVTSLVAVLISVLVAARLGL